MRLVLYEAVRRCIEGAKNDVLRTAYASTTQVLRAIHPPPTNNKSITQVLKTIEEDSFTRPEMLEVYGIWEWATEEKAQEILDRYEAYGSTMQDAPDFNEVMTYPSPWNSSLSGPAMGI